VTGKERVRSDTRFQMASDSKRVTRQAVGPWNLRPGTARLDIRRNFSLQIVVAEWNKIYVKCSVVDPKLFISDPDPDSTLTLISDPDCL
jgi:hypothetical protein